MNLKEVREKAKLSQAAFAKTIGVSSSAVASVEAGRMKTSQKIIDKVKEVYGEVIEPGEKDTREFGLWLYGNKLPKGDYRILIGGQDGDETNYVCAEYKIK